MSLCYLLAAGEGRRLRPVTTNRPKPCLEFLTLPLAHYGFYLARQGEFSNFLINKHHLPDQIEQLAKELDPFADSVQTIDEPKKLLGSGGALWNAKRILGEHDFFMVANGDEILIPQNPKILKALVEKFHHDQPLCTLLTCNHPELLKSLKAVWVNSKAEVRAFGMETDEEGLSPVHYTGYKIFSRKILDRLPEGESNIFYDVLKQAIAEGEKVTTLHMDVCSWHETGNLKSFLSASTEVAQSCWPEIQKRIAFFKRQSIICTNGDRSVFIRPEGFREKLVTRGLAVIGYGVGVSPGIEIENSIIESGSIVDQNLKDTMLLRETS